MTFISVRTALTAFALIYFPICNIAVVGGIFACIDVFEAVCNDVSIMTSFSTEFGNITAAYEFMEARISQLKDKIAALPVDEEEGYNPFSLIYTRGGSKTLGGYISGIPKENISKLS